MTSLEKLLDGSGLGKVWKTLFECVQKITGNVNFEADGNLQEQISELSSKTVHTDANQGLNDSQKEIARNNIGAPASDHTHDGRYYTENEIDEKLSEKLGTSGDSKNVTTTFASQDSTNVTAWTEVGVLTSGEKHSSILQKVSTMFKNVRYLYHMLGTADISTLGDGADIGTVTGALSKLNSDLSQYLRLRCINHTGQTISINDLTTPFTFNIRNNSYQDIPDDAYNGENVVINLSANGTSYCLIQILFSTSVTYGKIKIFSRTYYDGKWGDWITV